MATNKTLKHGLMLLGDSVSLLIWCILLWFCLVIEPTGRSGMDWTLTRTKSQFRESRPDVYRLRIFPSNWSHCIRIYSTHTKHRLMVLPMPTFSLSLSEDHLHNLHGQRGPWFCNRISFHLLRRSYSVSWGSAESENLVVILTVA